MFVKNKKEDDGGKKTGEETKKDKREEVGIRERTGKEVWEGCGRPAFHWVSKVVNKNISKCETES